MYEAMPYDPITDQGASLLAQFFGFSPRGMGAAAPAIGIVDLTTLSSTVFTAGDPFTLQIQGGAPNAVVAVTAANFSNPNQGVTDANGNYSLTDITPATPGQISQSWTVGGVPVSPSPLVFTIQAPATQQAATAAAASGTPAGQATAQAALTTVANSSSPLGFLTSSISLFGITLPAWGWAGGAVGLMLLLTGGKRR